MVVIFPWFHQFQASIGIDLRYAGRMQYQVFPSCIYLRCDEAGRKRFDGRAWSEEQVQQVAVTPLIPFIFCIAEEELLSLQCINSRIIIGVQHITIGYVIGHQAHVSVAIGGDNTKVVFLVFINNQFAYCINVVLHIF
ncbi:hypothetical protein D9M68_641440 [compost metagenome]